MIPPPTGMRPLSLQGTPTPSFVPQPFGSAGSLGQPGFSPPGMIPAASFGVFPQQQAGYPGYPPRMQQSFQETGPPMGHLAPPVGLGTHPVPQGPLAQPQSPPAQMPQLPVHTANPLFPPAQGQPAPAAGAGTQRRDHQNAEDCLEDNCGQEDAPPRPDQMWCGCDFRPAFPALLGGSTLVGGLTFLFFQVPLMAEMFHLPRLLLSVCFSALWALTLACMIYCIRCDPGQLKNDVPPGQGQSLIRSVSFAESNTSEAQLPKRTYKSWQYKRPVRRYDHYCRWLTNGIALLNHREFFVMLTGLVTLAVLGAVIDSLLAFFLYKGHEGFRPEFVAIGCHFFYSVALLYHVGPMLQTHVGLIMRNELAQEWKRNDHNVAMGTKKGDNVPANDLSDVEDFNEAFDRGFIYDPKRNRFDRGWLKNCYAFWAMPRWPSDELGEW